MSDDFAYGVTRKSSSRSVNAVRGAVLLALALCQARAIAADSDDAASATPADSNGSALQEIVVTAQRRAQNVQDVPITVSAVTGDLALAHGITEVTDLPMLAPGLSITREVGNDVIYMRGVGNNNSTAGQEQNIAIYIDGIYYPSMSADPGSFTNLERIEVLKGPQGTLFGRNTTGGLIQFVTKDPGQEFHANADVGYGNFGTYDSSGYLSGGITSNLAADVSVAYHDQSQGWGRNLYDGSDVNRARSTDVRSKWVFTPLDGTKFTLYGSHTSAWTDQGLAEQILSTTPLPPSLGGVVKPDSLYNINQNVAEFNRIGQTALSLRFDQELGAIKFASISAYQNLNRQTRIDLDVTPVPELAAGFPSLTSSFSQEFQVASNTTGRLNWVGGLMYFYMNGREKPLAILAGPTELPVASYFTGQKTDSLAAYGQATIPILSATNLTVGGRYTRDTQELYGHSSVFTGTGYLDIPVDPSTNSRHFGDFTYKVVLDRHFTDDIMAFASVSTGFKSGVYNVTFSAPDETPVKPEKLTDFEVGMKSELFDHRVRLNMDAFYYDYKDLQLQTFITTTIVTLNAASAKIYGVEAEFETNITSQLHLHAGASGLRSRYEDFNDVPTYDSSSGIGVPILGRSGSGNQLLRTPSFQANAALDYDVPLPVGSLVANATYFHTSGFYFEPDNRLSQSAYNLVNGQLMWKSSEQRYNVRLWAKNIFNQQYYNQKISGAGSADAGAPGAPRTYGVSVGVTF
jgi:iron complex outermembrane recepter protein